MARFNCRKDITGIMTKPVNQSLASWWNIAPTSSDHTQRPALMATWAIGSNFGGMTTMCLKRASIFAAQGIPSAVTTFAFSPDIRSEVRSAVASGKLSPEVVVANMHEYYALRRGESAAVEFRPTATDDLQWVASGEIRGTVDSAPYCLEFEDAGSGQLKRREYYRADGSLYLLDCQLPPKTSSGTLRRVLQLQGADGNPTREFNTTGKFYRHWLSELVGELQADVIVDSKFVAGFLWRWEHPGTTKSAVLHSTHVQAGQNLMTGTLNKNQQGIISHRDNWDRVVLLTHGQARAFKARFGDNSNVSVISNPVNGPAEYPAWSRRDRYKLLYIGRLAPNKNVNKAIAVVSGLVKSGVPATLDIIGDGPKRDELKELVAKLGLREHVHFAGYVSDVPHRLDRAGAVLLCSDFEGQPLALLEAKSHGCVPVSFDIDFGPRDVITSGVSGILIAFDDISGMTADLAALLRDEEAHAAMSQSAFREASAYAGPMIFREWKDQLEQARASVQTRRKIAAGSFAVEAISFNRDGSVGLLIEGSKIPQGSEVFLVAQGRQAPISSGTQSLTPSRAEPSKWWFDIPQNFRTYFPSDKPVDFHIALNLGSIRRTIRLGVHDAEGLLPLLTGYGNLSIR